MAKGLYTIEVKGLGEALLVPGQLELARVEFPQRMAIELAADLRYRTRGRLPHETVIRGHVVTGGTVIVGTEGSKAARALDEGATILPLKGRRGRGGGPAALKFIIGGRVVFARRSLIKRNRPGGKSFTRALRYRRRIIERVWAEVM